MESNKIDLFCGPNSLGVPYTRDNKNHFGYFDYVKQELEKLNYDVMGINFSSLNKNYTWDFEKMFKENYSLLQIKNIKISSIEEMRNANFLFKFVITEEYEDYLKKTSVDASKKIRTIYENSEKPIVLFRWRE